MQHYCLSNYIYLLERPSTHPQGCVEHREAENEEESKGRENVWRSLIGMFRVRVLPHSADLLFDHLQIIPTSQVTVNRVR